MPANGKPLDSIKILAKFKNRRVNVRMRGDLPRNFTGVLLGIKKNWITVRNDKNINTKIRLDLIGEVEHAQPNFTLTLPPEPPKPGVRTSYSNRTERIKEKNSDEEKK